MSNKLKEAAQAYANKERRSRTELHAFIAGAEWQAQQSPWIKCSERLPGKVYRSHLSTPVNILYANGTTSTGRYNNRKRDWSDSVYPYYTYEVIGWQPLPPAPIEKENPL